jgi:hypothetical protein
MPLSGALSTLRNSAWSAGLVPGVSAKASAGRPSKASDVVVDPLRPRSMIRIASTRPEEIGFQHSPRHEDCTHSDERDLKDHDHKWLPPRSHPRYARRMTRNSPFGSHNDAPAAGRPFRRRQSTLSHERSLGAAKISNGFRVPRGPLTRPTYAPTLGEGLRQKCKAARNEDSDDF